MYYCTAALLTSKSNKKSCHRCGKIVAFIFQWWYLQGGVGLGNVAKTQPLKKKKEERKKKKQTQNGKECGTSYKQIWGNQNNN